MSEKATIAELDDEVGKVYVLGVDMTDMTADEKDAFADSFARPFDDARVVVIGLPIEGSVEISEMDRDEMQELIDYHNVMEGVQNG